MNVSEMILSLQEGMDEGRLSGEEQCFVEIGERHETIKEYIERKIMEGKIVN